MIWLIGILILVLGLLFMYVNSLKEDVDECKQRVDDLEQEIILLKQELEQMVGGTSGGVNEQFLSERFSEVIDHLYKSRGRMRKQ